MRLVRSGGLVVLFLTTVWLGGADDDLVRSTVEEAQSEAEPEERPPPRTWKSVHPLTDIPAPGEFASTRSYLASPEDLKWRVGDEVTVLCHFTHRLAAAVNVTGLMGSLNSPVHFGYYLQNFSYDAEHYVAAAGQDLTLDYSFRLDDMLDPGEWRVALTVFYQVGDLYFASTFFNETVTLAAPQSAVSWLVLVAALALLGGSAAYFGSDYAQNTKLKSQEAAAAKARDEALAAERLAADDQSWVAHLDSTDAKPKSRKQGGSKKVSKSGASKKK